MMTSDRDARINNLRAATARKSADAEARARRAIIALENTGRPINFNTVAAEGKVSKDFLYRNVDLRRRIIDRRRSPATSASASPAAVRSHEASAAVKLSVATAALQALRHENQQLREENARLQGDLLAERRLARLANSSSKSRSDDV